MRIVRVLALLIGAIVVLDFVLVGRGERATAPALVGAVAVSLLCWRDAASPRRRRLLAGLTCVLAAGLGVALGVANSDGAALQAIVMGGLLACSVPLSIWAIAISRKRRRPHGVANYLNR